MQDRKCVTRADRGKIKNKKLTTKRMKAMKKTSENNIIKAFFSSLLHGLHVQGFYIQRIGAYAMVFRSATLIPAT